MMNTMEKQGDVVVIPFPNSDFEDGVTGWTIAEGRGECGVTTDNVANGRYSLRITASAETNGARVDGPLVPCQGPGIVEFFGSVRSVSGRSLGLFVRQFDANGEQLPAENMTLIENQDGIWYCRKLLGLLELDARTAFLRIQLIAWPGGHEKVEAYVDDFAFIRPPLRIPPLPCQYKIHPNEREKLTPADVVGPDGVVYPNWTRVGVQGGIPEVPVVLRLDAVPETDISGLLNEACRQVGAQGGGAILIDEGTYYLDDPVTLRDNGVVIRGSGREKTRLIYRYSLVHPHAVMPGGWPEAAVFLLRGEGLEAGEYLLAVDGKRGDTTLRLESIGDLRVGDRISLRAPETPRWKGEVNDRSGEVWGRRVNTYQILAIDGNTLEIGQPLRIDFPAVDGSNVQRIHTLERCGVEDLTVEHACRMGFHTVNTHWTWNCWVRRVDVIDCGRSGVHFHAAKWCECRDCTFIGFDPAVHIANTNWWGYAGFMQSADCLMEDNVWHRFRHGPMVQFGAQGNVIRNCVFHGSDAQWHAGWATENLFENCIVDARGKYGSYGNGAFATGSNDTLHGPNGPRNVVYHCDFTSWSNGVVLNGVNENWLFLHNRFIAEKGAGLVGTCGAFDHIIRQNTFILQNDTSPLLQLKTADCVGIELIDNTLFGGNGKIYEGMPDLAMDRGNRALPLPNAVPDRPVADPPSIYAWQQRNAKGTAVR